MNLYNNGYVLFLPIETKDYLEHWLNTQFPVTESLFMKQTEELKIISSNFVENVIKQLQLQSKAFQDFPIKQKLFNTSLNVSDKFVNNPMVLYIGLRKWILIKRQLERLTEQEYENYSHTFSLIDELVLRVELIKDTIKSLNFFNSLLEVEVSQNKCDIYQEQSSSLNIKLTEQLISIIKLIENVENRVIMYLKMWHHNEVGVRKGLFKSNTAALNCIQSWFEQVADVIWNTQEQMKNLKTHYQDESKTIYQQLYQQINNLMLQLINNAFIVEEQPSLVLRTKTKLRVRCRLLIAKALIVEEFNTQLSCTVSILNEKQTLKSKSSMNSNSKPKGIVLNNVRTIEYIDLTNNRVVSFPDIKLDKMERSTRTNAVNIADEKYSLVFETNNLFKKDSKVKLLAISLPFIAIVHGNQESQAWAAVLWDSLDLIQDSDVLGTPRVSWNDMVEQLNKKFNEVVRRAKKRSNSDSIITSNEEMKQTSTKQNINFLSYMAFNHSVDKELPDNMSITWDGFYRDKLPGKNFSFWDFYYNAMKLIQECLSHYWNNKTIFGFIDKATAITELNKCLPGTFILRFSENELGGLTTTFKTLDNQINHIYPYTVEDYKIHSFLNRMRDLEELQFIYPYGVRKCDVLGERPPIKNSYFSDYVKTVLVTSICSSKKPSTTQYSNNQNNLNYYRNSTNDNANYHQDYYASNNLLTTYDYLQPTKTQNFTDTSDSSSYESPDSSTEPFFDNNNPITSSAFLLSSNNDYYL
ncbi:unnamed protein product [Diamesa serratosioi]